MVLFQWLNFYSYRQYESHTFMRKCRSMELLWKMQLPFDWTCQVNVFTYCTWMLLKGHLCKAVPLWQKQPAAILSCMCLSLFIYFQSFMQATWQHKCCHGNMMLVYVILPEFCSEFPLLYVFSGILDYLRNCSCLLLDKAITSSSSVYISYHCCTLSYFISVLHIEKGVQCKCMETKTIEAI